MLSWLFYYLNVNNVNMWRLWAWLHFLMAILSSAYRAVIYSKVFVELFIAKFCESPQTEMSYFQRNISESKMTTKKMSQLFAVIHSSMHLFIHSASNALLKLKHLMWTFVDRNVTNFFFCCVVASTSQFYVIS